MRSIIIGAVTLAVISVTSVALATTGNTTSAAAVPAAPYTAFTMSFLGWGNIDGDFSYEASRNTLDVTLQNANGYALVMQGFSPTGNHYLDVSPPSGTQFAAGTTYSATDNYYVVPDQADLHVAGDGEDCEGVPSGSVDVLQAAYDGSGKLTEFAASYVMHCGSLSTATGEIRYHSTIGYQATDSWYYRMDYGNQPVGVDGTVMTATVQVDGTQPTTFGAATLSGLNPGAFTISSNGCTGNTMTYGQSCVVHVTASATALGLQTALLTLADNSIDGKVTRSLSLIGYDPRDATSSPGYINFGDVPAFDISAPQTVTLTSSSILPITFGKAYIAVKDDTVGVASDPGAFGIISDGCSGVTLEVGKTCSMTVESHPGKNDSVYTMAYLTLPDNSVATMTQVQLNVNGFTSDQGTYYPLWPARILDTRSGLSAPKAAVGPGGVVHLQVTGKGGVPTSPVAAVVLNVTVTGPTSAGFLSVYPTGVTRPTASSLNFAKGWTGANSVTVAVGTGGKIDLYNSAGSTQLIVDVSGYYTSGHPRDSGYMGGQYHPVIPTRIADTRTWTTTPIPAKHLIEVPVSFGDSIDSHVQALAVNVTEVGATGTGYLTAWNGTSTTIPTASTLNYTAGKTVPNFAVVPVKPCDGCGAANGWPSIGVYTTAATNIIVDIVGFYDDSKVPDGMRFRPVVPVRIADSRYHQGLSSAIGPGATAKITAPSSVIGNDTAALAMNVTAVSPTTNTFLTVWPAGISGVGKPNVSNLNPMTGTTVPNAVQTLIGPAYAFNVYNSTGSVDLIADVVGTFYIYPGTTSTPTAVQAYRTQQGSPPLVRNPQ